MLPNPRRFDIAREVPLTAQKIFLPAHQMQEEDFVESRIHASGASGTSDEIDKSWQREILFSGEVWKREEYCMYFPFFKLIPGGNRSVVQPQTIYSEFP